MKFHKYPSIENSYRETFIEVIRNEKKDGGTYRVYEKVHGSNMSFSIDGGEKESLAFKRNEAATSDDNHCNYLKIKKELDPKLKELYKYVKSEYKDSKYINLFGEAFGGNFKHPDVEKVKNSIKVMKGILYSPDNHFLCFDLMSNGLLLPSDFSEKGYRECGLLYSSPLFEGTLDECLKYSNEFDSTIPQYLGYPHIEDNVCEGVVIKPVIPTFLNGGSRVIIKNKNKKWKEKANAKRRLKDKVAHPQHVLDYIDKHSCYITDNRLDNVLSKVGDINKEIIGKIIKEFSLDVMDDFLKENPDFNKLEKSEQKIVTKTNNSHISKMVIKKYQDSGN